MRCTSCVTTPCLKLSCPTQCHFCRFMYFLKCFKNHYKNVFCHVCTDSPSALQDYCNTGMHFYYQYVARTTVHIQQVTEWSIEVCKQPQAHDAAPMSRFPSFLPHRFRGGGFRLFYKHLGFPGPCRAPPARGCFKGLLRGSQRPFLRSFLGSFWTRLELSSHAFE